MKGIQGSRNMFYSYFSAYENLSHQENVLFYMPLSRKTFWFAIDLSPQVVFRYRQKTMLSPRMYRGNLLIYTVCFLLSYLKLRYHSKFKFWPSTVRATLFRTWVRYLKSKNRTLQSCKNNVWSIKLFILKMKKSSNIKMNFCVF